MRNAIIYPFSFDSSVIARYRHLIPDYNITCAVVAGRKPGGCHDACFYDEGEETGLKVSGDFDSELEQCDAVIWGEYNFISIESFYQSVADKIKYALSKGKEVVCLQKLENQEAERFFRLAEENKTEFIYINGYRRPAENDFTLVEKLNEIPVPVICVYGLTENCQKFHTQLGLRDLFLEEGYTVSQIGSRSYCEIFGFHSFPAFMMESRLPETQKILYFNRMVCDIVDKEDPDVVIIGIPDGMLRLNERFYFHFGTLPFFVSSAVSSDITILNLPCQPYSLQFIKEMDLLLKYKLNSQLDFAVMSNIRENSSSIMRAYGELEYDVLPRRYVEEAMDSVDAAQTKVFSAADSRGMRELYHSIRDTLSVGAERIW